jgi:DNA repair exonuclease SbcCD ATPase subunit
VSSCYNPEAMDKEALRKQIYDELSAQFESKLRDSKKQKSQVEEELESSSEKWRSERRRLNSEIDRLESALADTRDARRKASGAKVANPTETPEPTKLQAASDEKLKKATREWEAERARLEGEISRLQGGVAELLERANNPLRAGQAAREQLEQRLEEALKTKRQAEDSLIGAKEEWEKEKLKLAGEMVKLRRSLGTGKAPKSEPVEEDRAKEKELQKQLDETRKEIAQAKEAHAAELASIRNAAIKETEVQIERERRDSNATREALERDLQKTRKEITLLKDAQSADQGRQAAHLEEARKAQAKIRDLEQRVAEAKNAGGKEKTEQLEKQLEEAARKRSELEGQLGSIREAAAREYAERVERERRDAGQAREVLDHQLQNARKEIALLKGAQSADLERQAAQTEESNKAYAKIRDLERRIAEAAKGKDSAGKEQIAQLEKQLAEAARARQDLERDLKKAQQEGEELRRVGKRLESAQTEIQQLERRLDETKDKVSTEVVEQLRRQYDERMQDMIRQKTQLSEQLHSASSLLETERKRFAAAAAQSKEEPAKEAASGTTIDTAAMDAELARTEARIAEIAQLIDDPATDLSTVIRKNVERAELDAYLKGILFSLGRSHGL